MPNEEWRPIPGVIGYEASSEGRIRKCEHKILKPDHNPRNPRSYPRVEINNRRLGGPYSSKRFSVHSLVAKAFIGEIPDGMTHNHKDGDKSNARPENLEFVTQGQNVKHAYDVLGKRPQYGETHGMSKLTDSDVRTIHAMRKSGSSLAEISHRFGVNQSSVSQICRGRTWRHLKLEPLHDGRK